MSMCVFEVKMRLCLHLCLKRPSKEMKVYYIIQYHKLVRVLIVFNIFHKILLLPLLKVGLLSKMYQY
jgi:hypothetical protein